MRNERQAYFALESTTRKESLEDKAKRIMAMNKSYAFRLAALNACDTNKGKVWS